MSLALNRETKSRFSRFHKQANWEISLNTVRQVKGSRGWCGGGVGGTCVGGGGGVGNNMAPHLSAL